MHLCVDFIVCLASCVTNHAGQLIVMLIMDDLLREIKITTLENFRFGLVGCLFLLGFKLKRQSTTAHRYSSVAEPW